MNLPRKYGSVDVTFTHSQEHYAQSGSSTRSALYIFNTGSAYLLTNQSENKKLSRSVWIVFNDQLFEIYLEKIDQMVL